MRKLIAAGVAVAALAVTAPAEALNSGNQPPGPPLFTGGPEYQGAEVTHDCGKGVQALNRNNIGGNCRA